MWPYVRYFLHRHIKILNICFNVCSFVYRFMCQYHNKNDFNLEFLTTVILISTLAENGYSDSIKCSIMLLWKGLYDFCLQLFRPSKKVCQSNFCKNSKETFACQNCCHHKIDSLFSIRPWRCHTVKENYSMLNKKVEII